MHEPETAMTQEQAQRHATQALFFAGFGAVWVVTGLGQTHRASLMAMLCLCATTVLLLWATTHLMRRSRDLPPAYVSRERQVRMQRMFTSVNIILWVSVATAVAILGLLHMPEYIVPAISMLVGLHLLPLAGFFQDRQQYVTGAWLLLGPLACLAMLPPARVSGVCALGIGPALLLSAAVTLARALTITRTVHPHGAVARG